jgi:hypothetical protein
LLDLRGALIDALFPLLQLRDDLLQHGGALRDLRRGLSDLRVGLEGLRRGNPVLQRALFDAGGALTGLRGAFGRLHVARHELQVA